jgi:hypothetical protein
MQHVWRFGSGVNSVRLVFVREDQGAFAVDLALRLNVLAAFVALAFVGAILFGAF